VPVGDAFEQEPGGVGADLVARLVDAGEGDRAEGGEGRVGVWTRTGHRLTLTTTVPTNTTAEVRVPTGGGRVTAPARATFVRHDGQYAVYTVPSGT
jgi:hypothetical protein